MKRLGNVWTKIIALDNLYEAARKAQKGKRKQPNVRAFNDNLAENLSQLRQELRQKTALPTLW